MTRASASRRAHTRSISSRVRIRILRLDPVASYGFLNEELHVGAGLRFAAFYGVGVTEPSDANVYWLVVRAGSYLEPTCFRTDEQRLHARSGLDLRVLRSSVFGLFDEGTMFRASAAIDGARDYFGWSVGAGIFH